MMPIIVFVISRRAAHYQQRFADTLIADTAACRRFAAYASISHATSFRRKARYAPPRRRRPPRSPSPLCFLSAFLHREMAICPLVDIAPSRRAAAVNFLLGIAIQGCTDIFIEYLTIGARERSIACVECHSFCAACARPAPNWPVEVVPFQQSRADRAERFSSPSARR